MKLYSTGGTFSFINELGIPAEKVEDLTTYPSILGGRVKTLHPSVFGGILARRENNDDLEQLTKYKIPEIDLVIVDLYPFEETLKSTDAEEEIIEKIDIGGISLIRAAAKNYNDVLIVSGREQYPELLTLLSSKKGLPLYLTDGYYAAKAFRPLHIMILPSSNILTGKQLFLFSGKASISHILFVMVKIRIRKGSFYGDPEEFFDKLHGKELSYNNLLDLEAALNLIDEFTETTFVIIKHNNACGVASRENAADAWKDALACDPVSAFGGVIVTNATVDEKTAAEIDKIFFEIIIAPAFTRSALEILKQKKNRIILLRKESVKKQYGFRSMLNGVLWQERDNSTESGEQMKPVLKEFLIHQRLMIWCLPIL